MPIIHMYLTVWDLIKATWYIIRLFVLSLLNKTDIVIEYRKECNKIGDQMKELLRRTEEGQDLLQQAEEAYSREG
jgi:hypothetical protein